MCCAGHAHTRTYSLAVPCCAVSRCACVAMAVSRAASPPLSPLCPVAVVPLRRRRRRCRRGRRRRLVVVVVVVVVVGVAVACRRAHAWSHAHAPRKGCAASCGGALWGTVQVCATRDTVPHRCVGASVSRGSAPSLPRVLPVPLMAPLLGGFLVAMAGQVLVSVVVGPFIVVVPLGLLPSWPPGWPL